MRKAAQTGPATQQFQERRFWHHAEKKLRWMTMLVRHRGNIARASLECGFQRQRGTALTKRYGLSEFAERLRVMSGQPACGRPKNI